MAGITLEQAEAQLAAYIEAESKVLLGQSYEISNRKLTRADLTSIRQGIDLWDRRVKQLSAAANGRGRARNLSAGW